MLYLPASFHGLIQINLVLASAAGVPRVGLQSDNGCGQQTDVHWLNFGTRRWVSGELFADNDAVEPPQPEPVKISRETRDIAGWKVHISEELLKQDKAATVRALELLKSQLEEIVRVVPAPAVAELRKVPLWLSPEYAQTPPRAEYHPGAGWLREHKRAPEMAKGVEFTNIRIFEAESRRMPNFTLHELAHAYHHRVLAGGFGNPEIKTAYEKAKAGGKYDRVERQDAEGRKRMDRAYAISSSQEYFAETTEAFFSRNDFFPYNRGELKQHDPEMVELLIKLWGVEAAPR